jgi:lipoprotein-anchoring transpeptidase ErfK/SrfK
MQYTSNISRRDFLKLAGVGLGLAALRPSLRALALPEFPPSETGLLGRALATVDVHAKPDINSAIVGKVYDDGVVPWLREVNAINADLNVRNQRWVETPDGYMWSSLVQPVRAEPNTPLSELPKNSADGFWAEVTVPYVDLTLENPPARGPGVRYLLDNKLANRLYYSQVMWIDQIKQSESGAPLYRINERYATYGDIFWAEGAAFRPLTTDEITPLSPDVDPKDKVVKVNLTYQTASCFEGSREVYFCPISSGNPIDLTPLGDHITWRKLISIHMAGGTVAAGYDTAGISWTNLFDGTGVAIHSTFWHNDFGQPRSHGCVNCRPDDAKWIWRWTLPTVPLDPGDVTNTDMNGGTHVVVEQRLV